MVQIERLTPCDAETALPALAELLKDAVDGGASVSFLPPLPLEEAARFWRQALQAMAEGQRVVLVARLEGALVGVVTLDLARVPNGAHRAEVQKLLVHSRARGQGIGERLMRAVEEAALEAGRTLLVLDTCRGYTAERLYRRLGWVEAGVIPNFALEPNGYCDTVIFYKQLAAPPPRA